MLLALAIVMFVIAVVAYALGRHAAAQGIVGIGVILLVAWLVLLLIGDGNDHVNTAAVVGAFGQHRVHAGTWRLLV